MVRCAHWWPRSAPGGRWPPLWRRGANLLSRPRCRQRDTKQQVFWSILILLYAILFHYGNLVTHEIPYFRHATIYWCLYLNHASCIEINNIRRPSTVSEGNRNADISCLYLFTEHRSEESGIPAHLSAFTGGFWMEITATDPETILYWAMTVRGYLELSFCTMNTQTVWGNL